MSRQDILKLLVVCLAINLSAQEHAWRSPGEADKTQMPVRYQYDETRANDLFQAQCSMCHGSQGRGDGPLSVAYRVADLTSEGIQAQSDGALLWKIQQGRTPMPAYGHSLREEEQWDMVCLIRTLDSESKNHTLAPDSLNKNPQN